MAKVAKHNPAGYGLENWNLNAPLRLPPVMTLTDMATAPPPERRRQTPPPTSATQQPSAAMDTPGFPKVRSTPLYTRRTTINRRRTTPPFHRPSTKSRRRPSTLKPKATTTAATQELSPSGPSIRATTVGASDSSDGFRQTQLVTGTLPISTDGGLTRSSSSRKLTSTTESLEVTGSSSTMSARGTSPAEEDVTTQSTFATSSQNVGDSSGVTIEESQSTSHASSPAASSAVSLPVTASHSAVKEELSSFPTSVGRSASSGKDVTSPTFSPANTSQTAEEAGSTATAESTAPGKTCWSTAPLSMVGTSVADNFRVTMFTMPSIPGVEASSSAHGILDVSTTVAGPNRSTSKHPATAAATSAKSSRPVQTSTAGTQLTTSRRRPVTITTSPAGGPGAGTTPSPQQQRSTLPGRQTATTHHHHRHEITTTTTMSDWASAWNLTGSYASPLFLWLLVICIVLAVCLLIVVVAVVTKLTYRVCCCRRTLYYSPLPPRRRPTPVHTASTLAQTSPPARLGVGSKLEPVHVPQYQFRQPDLTSQLHRTVIVIGSDKLQRRAQPGSIDRPVLVGDRWIVNRPPGDDWGNAAERNRPSTLPSSTAPPGRGGNGGTDVKSRVDDRWTHL